MIAAAGPGKFLMESQYLGGQQSKLPSQVVKTRTQTISEFSGEASKIIGRDSQFDEDAVNALPRLVLSNDGIGIFPKIGNSPFEFFEVFIRPTNFYLGMSQPHA
jgi:hypothetical protein